MCSNLYRGLHHQQRALSTVQDCGRETWLLIIFILSEHKLQSLSSSADPKTLWEICRSQPCCKWEWGNLFFLFSLFILAVSHLCGHVTQGCISVGSKTSDVLQLHMLVSTACQISEILQYVPMRFLNRKLNRFNFQSQEH